MKLLLDTHLLLWAAVSAARLPAVARQMIEDDANAPMFSVASVWEVAIKCGLDRADFRVDARLLRRGLLDNGYEELPILGPHAAAVGGLPPIHKDPFDRLLIAQSLAEGILLLTVDPVVGRYPAPVRLL
ncbi:MAG TPA: type II toxin-antitoxin system VapC family toxin [Acetobacteraceae bacterium]|nr:type II toxin-antitoxin system VapC family toxin [Acetobacteraceae bacterium]